MELSKPPPAATLTGHRSCSCRQNNPKRKSTSREQQQRFPRRLLCRTAHHRLKTCVGNQPAHLVVAERRGGLLFRIPIKLSLEKLGQLLVVPAPGRIVDGPAGARLRGSHSRSELRVFSRSTFSPRTPQRWMEATRCVPHQAVSENVEPYNNALDDQLKTKFRRGRTTRTINPAAALC